MNPSPLSKGNSMQNPTAGLSPPPGAPRSPPILRISSRCPLSPAPGDLPFLTPSAVPGPLPYPSGDGWDEPERGWRRGVPRGPPHSTAADNRTENGSCSPSPSAGGQMERPARSCPTAFRAGEALRAALTPPSPGLGFARPPAMAGEGRACFTASSSTRLPKPRRSHHPGAAGGRARPRAGALDAALLNQSAV